MQRSFKLTWSHIVHVCTSVFLLLLHFQSQEIYLRDLCTCRCVYFKHVLTAAVL